jgi:hypothetical protein
MVLPCDAHRLTHCSQVSAIEKEEIVIDTDTKAMLVSLGFEDLPRIKVDEQLGRAT